MASVAAYLKFWMLSLSWVAFTSFTLVLVCHELARGSCSVNVHIVLSYSTPPPAGLDSLTVFIIPVFYLWCLTVEVSSERKNPADKCCIASESLQSWTRGKWLLWTVSWAFLFALSFPFPERCFAEQIGSAVCASAARFHVQEDFWWSSSQPLEAASMNWCSQGRP